MRYSCTTGQIRKQSYCRGFVLLLLNLLLDTFSFESSAQDCPVNIDFENGTFDGWTCYLGKVSAETGDNVISLVPSGGPVPGRHTMYSAINGGTDPYGGFSVNCPNGSRQSVQLGNDMGGAEAEGMSYEFVIPANRNIYSLIYHYAVVFQDPSHLEFQQPRMEIEIMNVTDNILIECSSFTFYPYGSLLPGFFISPFTAPGNNTPVWCKDWTAVSINLNDLAGKTIRLFFRTADCTFTRHFGYVYIDVNSECSDEFVGASYCPNDTAVSVVAPYGYESYTWYNNTFTQTLGTAQTLTLAPPPATGTTVAVELIPYNGYGCPDTLYAILADTLTVSANAGADMVSCNAELVPLGVIPRPGLVYNWSPPGGLSSPGIANPFANPVTTTSYILTASSIGGGCISRDTAVVTASLVNNALGLTGDDMYCINSGDSALLSVEPTDSIQWFKNDRAIAGANQPIYRVTQTGAYHAELYNNLGCSAKTPKQSILIESPRPGIRYPVEYAVINLPLTLQARPFGESVLWSPSLNLDNPVSYTPVFRGAEEQLYLIEIKTISGCLTVDTQVVKTIKSVEVYVPSAFTPNNDGLNDFLRPLLRGVKELRYFRVYNRWGQLLFDTKADMPGWNGSFKGMQQPTQVVVWVAEGIGVDRVVYQKKGTCVLLR